ncbi:MAG: twin-arginine translocation signal domain-containing protein, partial [Planctomycetota bacterium]
MKSITRRDFMKGAVIAGSALAFADVRGANERIRVGVVGLGGWGIGAHIPSFENQKNVTVVA